MQILLVLSKQIKDKRQSEVLQQTSFMTLCQKCRRRKRQSGWTDSTSHIKVKKPTRTAKQGFMVLQKKRSQTQTSSEKEKKPWSHGRKTEYFISLKSRKIPLCRMSHKWRNVPLKYFFFYGRSTACQKNKKPVKMQAVVVVIFYCVLKGLETLQWHIYQSKKCLFILNKI